MKTRNMLFPVRFRLETWVVGVNHCVTKFYEGDNVCLKREPDNRYDKYAVAVINAKEEKCGYLPRYDSRYLAPLLDSDAVEIRLEPTGERHDERVAIILHVNLTAKGFFVFDNLDDSAISFVYHQSVVEAWRRIESLSDGDIGGFRNLLRDLVHNNEVSFQTQFLYRMMRGVPEQRRIEREQKMEAERIRREQEEKERLAVLRVDVSAAVGVIEVREVIDCGRVVILPIVCSGPQVKMIHGLEAVRSGALTVHLDEQQEKLIAVNRGDLPVICPSGMVVSDGFDRYRLEEPSVVPGGGDAILETALDVRFPVGDDMPPVPLERDAQREEVGGYMSRCGEDWVRLALTDSGDKLSRLKGCRGAAFFVDGMFDRMELYSHTETLLSSFLCEHYFSAQDGSVKNSFAQMEQTTRRLIFNSRVTGERMSDEGQRTKAVDLTLLDAKGSALLRGSRCLFLGFVRWREFF